LNTYWIFEGDSRIFVRTHDLRWGTYDSASEFSELHDSLTPKGINERSLQQAIEQLRPPQPAAEAFEPVVRRSSTRARSTVKDEIVRYVNTFAK